MTNIDYRIVITKKKKIMLHDASSAFELLVHIVITFNDNQITKLIFLCSFVKFLYIFF